MAMREFIVSIAIVAVTITGLTLGGQSAHAERRMALVIGNGDYAVGPLDNPANDASLMADTLTKAGFEVTHHENLGYRDLQRAVVKFGRDLRGAGDDTVGMVYYAGHAVQANGENFLIPVDADIQDELDLEIGTLEVSTLMRSLDSAGNRLNMVVLDACRNNPFKAVSRSGTRGLAKIDAASGTLLAFSTAPGDVAADGSGRNSPYTAALAKAIQQPGLPVEQVFKRVRIEVMEKTGERQVPWESSSLTGDFMFVEPAPVVAAPTPEPTAPTAPAAAGNDAEIAFWTSIATTEDPALFQSYLDAYPNGLFATVARTRIASLEANRAQDQRRAKEEQARAYWDVVKGSDDPAVLATVIDRHGDTVYAELARARIDGLEVAARSSAAPAPQPDNSAELLFWQSIQNSTQRSDYQAYLDRFPDGSFAAIARDRAANGHEPQVAALPPVTVSPYDGAWTFSWKVVGRGPNAGSFPMCGFGEKGELDLDLREGKYSGKIKSNYSGTAGVEIEIGDDGHGTITLLTPTWTRKSRVLPVTVDDQGFKKEFGQGRKCHAELALFR